LPLFRRGDRIRSMAHYLLTGAAGFIGSHVAELLLSAGHTVTGIDELNDAYDVRLKQWRLARLRGRKGFSFRRISITDAEGVVLCMREHPPQAVINLAARAGVRASMENPGVYYAANVIGTLTLLEACRQCGVGKFILASTSSVYAGQPMPFSETLPVNEPISPYAASKKAAEVTVYTYHHLYGIDAVVFRYFTVYGPAGRPDMSVFKFIHLISAGLPIKVFGDGLQSRDFTFVEDVAAGTVRGLSLSGFHTINLGGNHPSTLRELIGLIEQETGRKAQIAYGEFLRTDVKATWADISRARTLLGWEPTVSLAEGIRRTAEWHRQNESWLKDIRLEP